MADLILGPILRYVDETAATVWVETDRPCEVTVLDHRARTFTVEGHHYALVRIRGLKPGRLYPYRLHLDGERVWPDPDGPLPDPVIRTRAGPDTRIASGSCRVSVPGQPRGAAGSMEDRGVDALSAYARRMLETDPGAWPDLLLMLGDQVYADDASPETREFIRSRRDTRVPPGEEVADFEEYTRLYREAWSQPPLIRWVLASVPSAMIFDDHDVIDDWNISRAWQRDMRATDWWDERIASGLTAYWVYQHLGNLAPADLDDDPLWKEVRAADDATGLLRSVAREADRDPSSFRWSFDRTLGGTRLVVVDSRAGRTFTEGTALGEAGRDMLDETEWRWLESETTVGADHLVVASSLPVFLPSGIHDLEQWNQAVVTGAWGRLARAPAERIRRVLDLEHWAAFPASLARLAGLLRRVADAPDGPASVSLLSGDVHQGYVARVRWEQSVGCPVWQVTTSPLRNALPPSGRLAFRGAHSRAGAAAGRLLARLAGVPRLPVDWRVVDGPVFENHIGTLEISGTQAELTIETARPGRDGSRPHLEPVVRRPLAL